MTRSIYTTVTPLPAGVPRDIVRAALHDHFLMIDLNPLVINRERMSKPLNKATPEEYHCTWYSITDRISYFPGVKGQVTYHACFHDLADGLQTHIYAPMGLDIKEKWQIGGNEPGEPRQTAEIGIDAPKDGLYLREDVDLSVNMMLLGFVKKNLVTAHKQLVARMVERARLIDNQQYNENLRRNLSQSNSYQSHHSPPRGQSASSASASQGGTFTGHPTSPGGQGYTSPSSVYDERFGPNGQGWNDQNTSPHLRPPSQTGPAPPYDHQHGHPTDQKATFLAPHGASPRTSELSPQDPTGRYRMTLDEAANPRQPQELPTTNFKGPAELE